MVGVCLCKKSFVTALVRAETLLTAENSEVAEVTSCTQMLSLKVEGVLGALSVHDESSRANCKITSSDAQKTSKAGAQARHLLPQ